MSQNSTPTENDANVLDGKARFAAHQLRTKRNKLIARTLFAVTVATAAVAAVKYISIPVPEWADDSEDV